MPFETSFYEIDITNNIYVSRIMLHNKQLKITHVNGEKLYPFVPMKELRDLFKYNAKNGKIKITCFGESPASTIDIFLPIPPDKLSIAIKKIPAENLKTTTEISTKIEEYIACQVQVAGNYKAKEFKNFDFIKSIAINQACFIIDSLTKKYTNLTGIHLSEINTIILQIQNSEGTQANNFALDYNRSIIQDISHIGFDLDEGFLNRGNREEKTELIVSLNKVFSAWVGYGSLFTSCNAGFDDLTLHPLEQVFKGISKEVIINDIDNSCRIKFYSTAGFVNSMQAIVNDLSKFDYSYTLDFSNCGIRSDECNELVHAICKSDISIECLNLDFNFVTQKSESAIGELIAKTELKMLHLKPNSAQKNALEPNIKMSYTLLQKVMQNEFLIYLPIDESKLTEEQKLNLKLHLYNNELKQKFLFKVQQLSLIKTKLSTLEKENSDLRGEMEQVKNYAKKLESTHENLNEKNDQILNLMKKYQDPRISKAQAIVRGNVARQEYKETRENVTTLQSVFKSFVVKKETEKNKNDVIKIQSVARIFPARNKLNELAYEKAVIKLQSVARIFPAKNKRRELESEVAAARVKVQQRLGEVVAKGDFDTLAVLAPLAKAKQWLKALEIIEPKEIATPKVKS